MRSFGLTWGVFSWPAGILADCWDCIYLFRRNGYKNNFRFPFSSLLTLVVSALQDAGGYAISRQNNLELHLGRHTCWLSYFKLVCLWCGRTVARAVGRSVQGHVINKFSRMGRLLHFLTHGASRARAPLSINTFRRDSLLLLFKGYLVGVAGTCN